MKLIFILLVVSLPTLACDKKIAFENGFKAVYEKYPTYKNQRSIFTIQELDGIWLFLRKEEIYRNYPKEYPRVQINKSSCNPITVLW